MLDSTHEVNAHPTPATIGRIAGWLDASRILDQRASSLEALSSSGSDGEARAAMELTGVADELRRMTEEATPRGDHHEPVWVTALDGNDEPALDENGHTYQHCGICGTKKLS